MVDGSHNNSNNITPIIPIIEAHSLKAAVAVSLTAYSFDKQFFYLVPKRFEDSACAGMRVIVPFGSGNRKRVGLVLSVEKYDGEEGLKPISAFVDSQPILSSEMLSMVSYLKEHTFCTYFEAFKTIIPSGMSIKLTEHYSLADDAAGQSLTDSEMQLLMLLRLASTPKEFNDILDCSTNPSKQKLIKSLQNKGILIKTDGYKRNVGDNLIKMLRLSDAFIDGVCAENLTPKQKCVADLLAENGSVSVKEACFICGVTLSVVKSLVKNGVADEYNAEALRIPDADDLQAQSVTDIILNPAQQDVFNKIAESLENNIAGCFLLHGVTGSGKTSVFKKLIAQSLEMGRQALLLIPEISLTPQIADAFKRLFGNDVALIHSALPLGRRADEYKRIKNGDVKIVIGTRSAVFAPLDNIGIIIMDEEGERSYKSEASPRYNTIDIAKLRCKTHNAVLLLASATPSVESYYYAQKGIYNLLELRQRYSDAPLPEVKIINMAEERANGNLTEFSTELSDAIRYNLDHHEQTILLLNRRGYHTIISCAICNNPLYCPNCSIPLTYHKTNDKLMCHYCGYSSEMVHECPECKSEYLKKMGFGTQKAQEELTALFPDARILRMDADTTFSRFAYEKKFKAFANGEYDIMLGTQMISKGLDFPNVTLVGVLSIDKALFSGDFRCYEKTFSLVTQVVGRGGRADKPARAYLQTFMPEHYVLNLASQQDYKAFYNEEIAIRRALIFPPICDICVLGLSSEYEIKVQTASQKLLNLIQLKIKNDGISFPLRVLGPVKCTYGKINGKYRYRIILKCKNNHELRCFISDLLIEAAKCGEFSKVSVYADINGDIGI